MGNKVFKTLGYVRIFTYLGAANITSKQKSDMTKVAIKNKNITSFGRINHIMDVFSKLGFEKLTESVLDKRGSSGKAFSHGSIFGSLLQLPLYEDYPEDINALTRQFNQSPGTLLPCADLTNTERLPRFTMNIKQARRTSTYKILTS